MADSNLINAVRELAVWLDRNDVDTKTLHLIINIADKNAATQFHAALQRETDDMVMTTLHGGPFFQIVKDLQIAGLKIKIETPFTEGT
jgi:hypothetical protein